MDSYAPYCSQAAYAAYGISTKECTIEYKKGRTDLSDTIETLTTDLLGLDDTSINGVNVKADICSGVDLGDAKWELHETVNLHLSLVQKTQKLDSTVGFGYAITHTFCQNIRYTTINICGLPTVVCNGDFIQELDGLLNLFGNITARELKLSNIRSSVISPFAFDISKIGGEHALPKHLQFRLNLKTLVLDNVNNQIISKLFNEYTFVSPVEVHILNQRYSNLDIVRILSHPIGQNITKLVLNDFSGLDEVKYYEEYKKEDRLTELPLFNYIETMKAENKTTSDLGLNKLILQLEGVDCSKYTEVLAEFEKLGIRCQAGPVQTYINRQIAYYKEYLMAATKCTEIWDVDQALDLYNVDLHELKKDLINRSIKCTSQPSKSPTQKLSLETLKLYFSDNQVLTEDSLVDIIGWVACQFTDLKDLTLLNLDVSEHTRKLILNGNYYTVGLETLKAIEIKSEKSQIRLPFLNNWDN
ncbi:hypothetical protein NEHOM01_1227 [Nematocida homosporus]|uniref:uncharacterized protein n=1 Tax=Nematocida homosporus TaxID=1912981 RepID=UPI00221F40EC|nr:uncharacterized protein NEHOM01_1227 [Nematocida homosporus]KAI5186024.1 hypothetical protein NEHOM01_1227 [Nematocida homosporus]